MDSELTSIVIKKIRPINVKVLLPIATTNIIGESNKRFMSDDQETKLDSVSQ